MKIYKPITNLIATGICFSTMSFISSASESNKSVKAEVTLNAEAANNTEIASNLIQDLEYDVYAAYATINDELPFDIKQNLENSIESIASDLAYMNKSHVGYALAAK